MMTTYPEHLITFIRDYGKGITKHISKERLYVLLKNHEGELNRRAVDVLNDIKLGATIQFKNETVSYRALKHN